MSAVALLLVGIFNVQYDESTSEAQQSRQDSLSFTAADSIKKPRPDLSSADPAPAILPRLSEPELAGPVLSGDTSHKATTAPETSDQSGFAPESTVFGFPPAFIELVQLVVDETNNGNYTSAALAAVDAVELTPQHPEKHEFLHQMAGLNYERAGLLDFAAEQYRLALSLNPAQRSSHDGLRRLDPEFRASNPPLPEATAIDGPVTP